MKSPPMGYLYRLHDFPHILRSEDFEAWGCHKAARLLNDSPRDTTWIYLDGSAGQGGLGSAATIIEPDGVYWFYVTLPPITPPKALSIGQFLCHSGGSPRYIPQCNVSF